MSSIVPRAPRDAAPGGGRIVIAGVTSGVGKTTIACALMAAWRRRGNRVQPFKVGPDYIDPGFHTQAAGQSSRNLDSVMLSAPALQALFARAATSAPVSVVEGVMGLFDGQNDRGETGSTAHVAKLIGAPVVVVIDVAKVGRTAGAVALGCAHFDPTLQVAGFILNRVASPTHDRVVREAVEAATALPVLGSFPRDETLTIPERHLGLVPTSEGALDDRAVARLADAGERHLELDRLWSVAQSAHVVTAEGGEEHFRPGPASKRVVIAVAHDRAFNFYYEDSLDVLRAWGAELVPFSPLVDTDLPIGAQGAYFGGGFPEVFADELATNLPLHAAIGRAGERGAPIYGECGGLMYLGRTLTDFEGATHHMVGLLPLDSAMQRRRATLGYRTATVVQPSFLLSTGAQVVGHEFHYSELAQLPGEDTAAYRLAERGAALEGYARGNVLASYVHLHFGSDPSMARRFVEACAQVVPRSPSSAATG